MSITELDSDLWVGTGWRYEGSTTDWAKVRDLVSDGLHRAFALVGLILVLPLIAFIALAVRLDSPGPVLFRQTRIGRNGRQFVILKFRTMRDDAEALLDQVRHLNESDGPLFKIHNDPRVSGAGRWLRRFSLDELPQLWNVVRGDMSLVGPRPPLPHEVAAYDDRVWGRLAVKPGLTGAWQVSGRSDLHWEEGIQIDLDYVAKRSLALDAQILVRTVSAVLTGRGAY